MIRRPRVAIAGALDHLFREAGGSRNRWEPRRAVQWDEPDGGRS